MPTICLDSHHTLASNKTSWVAGHRIPTARRIQYRVNFIDLICPGIYVKDFSGPVIESQSKTIECIRLSCLNELNRRPISPIKSIGLRVNPFTHISL